MEKVGIAVGALVLLAMIEWASPGSLESFAVWIILRVLTPIGAVILIGGLIIGAFAKAFKGW